MMRFAGGTHYVLWKQTWVSISQQKISRVFFGNGFLEVYLRTNGCHQHNFYSMLIYEFHFSVRDPPLVYAHAKCKHSKFESKHHHSGYVKSWCWCGNHPSDRFFFSLCMQCYLSATRSLSMFLLTAIGKLADSQILPYSSFSSSSLSSSEFAALVLVLTFPASKRAKCARCRKKKWYEHNCSISDNTVVLERW